VYVVKKIYDCENKCPIYSICQIVHVDVVGTIHGGRYDIESYKDCNYYRNCFDKDDKYSCLFRYVSEEWDKILGDEYYYDDEID